jgi:hypothetical protein
MARNGFLFHLTLLGLPLARGQYTFGVNPNHLPTAFDSDAVSQAFPDVEVDLISPFFTMPDTILPGFANGTQPPTDDSVMGEQ